MERGAHVDSRKKNRKPWMIAARPGNHELAIIVITGQY